MAKVVETQANLERQLELIETHQDEVLFIDLISVYSVHTKGKEQKYLNLLSSMLE